MLMSPIAEISIIIPVFNDLNRLEVCLAALQNQTYTHSAYEVIVVDNNSKEDIKGVVTKFSQVVYAYEAKKGSYAARNRGIEIAKGKILAFTDSDCIPAPDWLEKGVKALTSTPNCGLVAGKIQLFFSNADHPTLTEIYESFTAFQQQNYVERQHYGATANVFAYKTVFDQVGLFNPDLKSGGDREWGYRVHTTGYKQIYAEDVCVRHPARSSFSEMQAKLSRVIKGRFDSLETNSFTFLQFLGTIKNELRQSVRDILKIAGNKQFDYKYRVKGIFITLVYSLIRIREVIKIKFLLV